MVQDLPDEKTVFSFFREHPILIITFSAFLCSAVGYWSEYSLLKEFGLNIVIFAEIDDFFLAGLKSPKIFLVALPLFIISITYISFRLNRLAQEQIYISREELKISHDIKIAKTEGHQELATDLETKQKEMKEHFRHQISMERRRASLMVIPIVITGVISIFLFLQMELGGNLDRIVNHPSKKAIVSLRTGEVIPKNSDNPLVFITATEKFMFFTQSAKKFIYHCNTNSQYFKCKLLEF
ncbi:hypothetical protein JCM19236_5030 [Vibrio sp. JCM 19236]|nr:hypothetical protein JCM19236_5030 [Vibrio sp. JCM 19236]